MNLPSLHHGQHPLPATPPQPGGFSSPQGPWGAQPLQPAWSGVSAEQKLELLEYWRSILKRKWAIAGLTIAAAVVAGVISLSMEPTYRASATVLIESGKGKVVALEDVYTSSHDRDEFQTQIELIKSREVAKRAVDTMKLWNQPEFDPRVVKPTWRQRMLASVGISEEVAVKSDWTEAELSAAATGRLAGRINVVPVRMSQLVRVEFEGGNSELAASIVNAVAAAYIESDRAERYKLTTQVSQQLQDRLVSLRENLDKSEKALQAYREKKGIVNVAGSAQTGTTQQMSGVTERMLAARARRIELEGQYSQVRSASPSTLSSLPVVVRDPGVADALKSANAASSKLADLQTRLGPAHDQVQQAQSELAQANAQLQERQSAVANALVREYEAARSMEVALERSMGTVKDAAQNVNREEFQLSILEREYQSNRQLFDMFMTRSKETNVIGQIQPAVARITDPALPPEGSVKPNRRNIVMTAALLALLLGALASVAIDRLDNTVKGSEDAETRLHSPVLASLPEVVDASRKSMARAFLQDGHSQFSEGIRTARTGVSLSGLDAPNKILLVTSSVPGEGKTTISVNLAFAHAQSNTRTLLIDCDMRRSQASKMLGLGAHKAGLTSLVAGRATIEECVRPVKNSNLFMLPVGEIPPNPLDLLLSQKFKDTLAELSKQYPMIIIDSPPVELVSEALVLAPLVTNVAVVVRAMSTPAPLIRKTQLRLQRAGGQLLGVIINGLNFKEARAYYGEYAHSSYSYAYGDDSESRLPSKDNVLRMLKGKMSWSRSKASQPDISLDKAA